MVEEPTARLQESPEPAQVLGELFDADVLEHPDARDGVVRPVVDVAVVLEPDLDPAVEPGVAHALPGEAGLLVGDGDPDGLDTVVPGGVERHASPPAADVEEAHARLQRELAADRART